LFSPIAVENPPKEADGVAIIRHEFKFDLDAYFAKTPKAPVRSWPGFLKSTCIIIAQCLPHWQTLQRSTATYRQSSPETPACGKR
jgi:hypothetical protein